VALKFLPGDVANHQQLRERSRARPVPRPACPVEDRWIGMTSRPLLLLQEATTAIVEAQGEISPDGMNATAFYYGRSSASRAFQI
jgi:hypothetical protein